MKIVTTTVPQAELPLVAKAVLLGDGTPGAALQIAESLGMPLRVRTALAAMQTTDTDLDAVANTLTIATTFAPLLRNTSAFFRALDAGMIRVPLRERVSFLTGAATFGIVNERSVTKVQRVIADKVFADPVKACGILIFSKEMLKWLSVGGDAWLTNELRRAIAAGVDTEFFAMITDGSTPTAASTGSNAVAAAVDLRYLFYAVGLTAESRPFLVAAPDVALKAATLIDNAGFLFPQMTPQGGVMCGVPAIVCDAVAAGTLGLIDAAGLAGDMENIQISTAGHADVQIDDNPDSPPSASTPVVNLWVHNLVGLKSNVWFAAERLRANAYAKVTGISWGSTDSPA